MLLDDKVCSLFWGDCFASLSHTFVFGDRISELIIVHMQIIIIEWLIYSSH